MEADLCEQSLLYTHSLFDQFRICQDFCLAITRSSSALGYGAMSLRLASLLHGKIEDVGNDHLLSMRGARQRLDWLALPQPQPPCRSIWNDLGDEAAIPSHTYLEHLIRLCNRANWLGGSGGLPCPEPWVSLNCHSTFLEAQGPQPSRHRIISDQITFPTLPWVQSNARKMTCSTWL